MPRLPRLSSSTLAIGAAAGFVVMASVMAIGTPETALGQDWALRGTLTPSAAEAGNRPPRAGL